MQQQKTRVLPCPVQDPLFVDFRAFDLHLSDVLSPAVGAGSPVIANEVPFDLEGNHRTGTPDLGAYQLKR